MNWSQWNITKRRWLLLVIDLRIECFQPIPVWQPFTHANVSKLRPWPTFRHRDLQSFFANVNVRRVFDCTSLSRSLKLHVSAEEGDAWLKEMLKRFVMNAWWEVQKEIYWLRQHWCAQLNSLRQSINYAKVVSILSESPESTKKLGRSITFDIGERSSG